jgi:hypothetical protein
MNVILRFRTACLVVALASLPVFTVTAGEIFTAGDGDPEIAAGATAPPLLFLAHPASPTTPGAGTLNQPSPTSIPFTKALVLTTGAGVGPGSCTVVTCSDFDLTIGPGVASTKLVRVTINWTVPTNDYDLYVFEQTAGEPQVAVSGAGPPTTTEQVVFKPAGPGALYQILIVHFASSIDNITGVAELIDPPVGAALNRALTTQIVFSPNGNIQTSGGEAPTGRGTTFAQETTRDGEPSIRADFQGTVYPAGIRGVPAGVDVWRFGPQAFCPRFEFHEDSEFPNPTTDPTDGYIWLGQPDGIFAPVPSVIDPDGKGTPDAGGGDIELAVNFTPFTGGIGAPNLAMVSLTLASITSANSIDRGTTFSPVNAAAAPPLDDRQWIEAYGEKTVYLYYRSLAIGLTGLVLQKSTNAGFTFVDAITIQSALGFTPGWIDVDQTPNPNGSVDIYLSAQNSTTLVVFHCVDPNPTGASVITCTQHTVDATMSHGHIFDVVTVSSTNDDTYTVWSNNQDIWYSWSDDKGATWAPATQVTTAGVGGMPGVNIFPWITAGTHLEGGRIGIVWYGTTPVPGGPPNGSTSNADDNAEWKVFYALITGAKNGTPQMLWRAASDHVIHKGNVSQAGFDPNDTAVNRNLIDFFQVTHDPRDGAALIAFADDHNDFDGATYYTRQIAGPGLFASPNPTVPASCPPLAKFSNPPVRDFLGDQTVSADVTFPVPDLDIINVQYGLNNGVGTLTGYFLQAEMVIAQLPPLGPRSYRAYFSVNTQRGLMDVGNEYFVEMTTEFGSLPPSPQNPTGVAGTPQFFLGVLDRLPDGLTQERRVENITADQFNPIRIGSPNRLIMFVNLNRLDYSYDAGPSSLTTDDVFAAAPVPGLGSLVIGLRGRTRLVAQLPDANPNQTPFPPAPFVSSVVDETRGGSFILLNPTGGTANQVTTLNSAVSTFGGWHQGVTSSGTEYARNVAAAAGGQRPFVEFQFAGSATSVRYDYLTSSRGRVVEVFIDGKSKGTVDQFRASSDPTGSADLVGASKTFSMPAQASPHTMRVVVRTDLVTAGRDMAYVQGFNVAGGATGQAAVVDQAVQFSHLLKRGAAIDHVMVADASSLQLTAVIEPAYAAQFASNPFSVKLLDAAGALVGTAAQVAPGVLGVSAPAPGSYTLKIVNTGDRAVRYNAALVTSERTF